MAAAAGAAARPAPRRLRPGGRRRGYARATCSSTARSASRAPVGAVELGVGAWGAAQPGAARLDAGPGLAYRLPLRGANVRIEADWRFRLAGDAAPGSGPALTLATDF